MKARMTPGGPLVRSSRWLFAMLTVAVPLLGESLVSARIMFHILISLKGRSLR